MQNGLLSACFASSVSQCGSRCCGWAQSGTGTPTPDFLASGGSHGGVLSPAACHPVIPEVVCTYTENKPYAHWPGLSPWNITEGAHSLLGVEGSKSQFLDFLLSTFFFSKEMK